ncbi:hypothetical protein JCM24511_09250 [Saitozyma sp. JCM 24511]|nr:hypothetical protein JCM24511_09250 [Saitozyma sp. JCM 24511]
MKSRPVLLRAMRTRQLAPLAPLAPLRPTLLRPPPSLASARPLSSTSRRWAESESKSDPKSESKSEQKSRPPPEDVGPPQSPFKVFAQVLKEEISKNKAWQDNVKQLQGDVDKMADSAAMRRAREVYERARIASMIQNNPRIQAAAADLKRRGISVSEAISKSLEDSGVLDAIRSSYGWAASTAARATQPVRDTAVYKALAASIEETFDDTTGAGSRYGGYEEKESRRRRREARAKKAGKTPTKRVQENPDAGEALVLSKNQPAESRFTFITSSPTYQRWMEHYYESESPFISTLRSITSTVGSWFDENETAQVIRAMREIDPDFRLESFTGELREYIVPEVVDAYLSADRESLKQWCGEATFNVLWATMGQYVKQGLVSDSKILDIKHVDINTGKMLENNIPVFLVTFATQELLLFRNAKTGDVVVGSENDVEQCRYAMVLTRVDTELDNELTGGWKVVEMARRGAKGFM